MLSDVNITKLQDLINDAESKGVDHDDIQNGLIPAFKAKYDTTVPEVSEPVKPSWEQTVFPSSMKAASEDRPQALSQIMDLASLPGRTFAGGANALSSILEGKPKEALGSATQAMANQTNRGGLVEEVVKDPTLIPSLAIGGPGLVGGIKMGLTSALGHQLQNVSEEKKLNPLQAGIETASGALPWALSKIPLKRIVSSLGSQLTGVSKEALEMASTKEGRNKLATAAGSEAEIGDQLVNKIQNAYKTIAPIGSEAHEALLKTPDINSFEVAPLRKAIIELNEKTKIPALTEEGKIVQDKLSNKLKEFINLFEPSATGSPFPTVPAMKLYNFRKELDDIIDPSQFGQTSEPYIASLKTLRHDIKETLIDAAPLEYANGMKQMATKLDALDKMKRMMGKNITTQEARSESFVNNILNKGKSKQQEWLNNFEKEFPDETENIMEQVKNAKLARQFGPEAEGVPGLLPVRETGRSTLGTILGAAGAYGSHLAGAGPLSALSIPAGMLMSSPKVVTHAAIPTANAFQELSNKYGTQAALQILRSLQSQQGAPQ